LDCQKRDSSYSGKVFPHPGDTWLERNQRNCDWWSVFEGTQAQDFSAPSIVGWSAHPHRLSFSVEQPRSSGAGHLRQQWKATPAWPRWKAVPHRSLDIALGRHHADKQWNEPGEGDYINIEINMPVQPGQDGHCGNFNGNPQDDDRLAIRARVGTTGVPQGELLFNTKHPVVQANRPDLNNCPSDREEAAKRRCQQQNAPDLHGCMVDDCFGGKAFAREGAVGW